MMNFLQRYLRKRTINAESNTSEKLSADQNCLKDFLASAHKALGEDDFAAASNYYRQSISIAPRHHPAHIGLGFCLLNQGEAKAALQILTDARALNPGSVDGRYLVGRSYEACGNNVAAIREFQSLQKDAPEFQPVYLDLCRLLFASGDAQSAEVLMLAGTERFPEAGNFWFYLGNLQSERGDYVHAVASYRRALDNERSSGLLASFATALLQTGNNTEALGALGQSLALDPLSATTYSTYLLCLQYARDISAAERFAAAREYSRRFEEPLEKNRAILAARSRSPDQPLRVGYVSGDFRNHSLAFFILPILEHHDHRRFEIFGYHAHPAGDATTEKIRNLCDHWVPCHALSDEALAARIRSDGIDVLIDLSGHTGYNRLLTFARRPAPLQMTWLGYQATTGLKAMDYRITEESLDPTGTTEQFHSEKLLRLASSGTFQPHLASPDVNELPALTSTPFTFACLNNPSKITDEALELWSRILLSCPGSRLLIGNAGDALSARFTALFTARGVDSGRLWFEPKCGIEAYLALHRHIDLALDTFPYNGGTTTFHSLWMGVPIIALEGDTPMSRVGASIMRGLDLGNFCASTPDEYVACAVHHFQHIEALALTRRTTRAKLAAQCAELARTVTAELEEKILACWTAHIAVPPDPSASH